MILGMILCDFSVVKYYCCELKLWLDLLLLFIIEHEVYTQTHFISCKDEIEHVHMVKVKCNFNSVLGS